MGQETIIIWSIFSVYQMRQPGLRRRRLTGDQETKVIGQTFIFFDS